MRKIIYLCLATIFSIAVCNIVYAKRTVGTNISVEDSKEIIELVEAQDMYGRKTINLSIWGRQMANGKYFYFAMTKGKTREFAIQRANNNHTPFYVKIGDERWYFSSTTLDLYSLKTDQW